MHNIILNIFKRHKREVYSIITPKGILQIRILPDFVIDVMMSSVFFELMDVYRIKYYTK